MGYFWSLHDDFAVRLLDTTDFDIYMSKGLHYPTLRILVPHLLQELTQFRIYSFIKLVSHNCTNSNDMVSLSIFYPPTSQALALVANFLQ